ncbi:MAG: hypothetical protein IJM30_13080 [Thermoguttaceae bacterium]|nr:hypothetical protein [Thermoguttaceae bacterium]
MNATGEQNRELVASESELDRRESVLNARIARFEAIMRSRAEDLGISTRAGASSELAKRAAEFEKIADAMDARERKLAEMAASIRAQALELEQKRAETEQMILRIAEVREELDQKERMFDERSRRALEALRSRVEEAREASKAA